MEIRPFRSGDEPAVVDLWRQCDLVRAWNNPSKDIARKLTTQAEFFVVGELDGRIIATMMFGYDGHRGWVNYLAVAPEHRRLGLGRTLMEYAEVRLMERGCPKLNLQVRVTNKAVLDFYTGIGYEVDNVVSLGKRLISDLPES